MAFKGLTVAAYALWWPRSINEPSGPRTRQRASYGLRRCPWPWASCGKPIPMPVAPQWFGAGVTPFNPTTTATHLSTQAAPTLPYQSLQMASTAA